jgi:sensor c-di-GMP phosphodiesterase-like protein
MENEQRFAKASRLLRLATEASERMNKHLLNGCPKDDLLFYRRVVKANRLYINEIKRIQGENR